MQNRLLTFDENHSHKLLILLFGNHQSVKSAVQRFFCIKSGKINLPKNNRTKSCYCFMRKKPNQCDEWRDKDWQ